MFGITNVWLNILLTKYRCQLLSRKAARLIFMNLAGCLKKSFKKVTYKILKSLWFEKIIWYFMHLIHFHRWTGKILKGIPINERLCPFCKTNHIVGEFHYITECSVISQVRLKIKKNPLDLIYLLNFRTCWHWCKIIKKTVCLLQKYMR